MLHLIKRYSSTTIPTRIISPLKTAEIHVQNKRYVHLGIFFNATLNVSTLVKTVLRVGERLLNIMMPA